MKLQRVVMLTGFAAWTISVVNAQNWPPEEGSPHRTGPKTPPPSGSETPAKPAPPARPLDQLISDLADPDFRTREEASRSIWSLGEAALDPLKQAAKAKDPEQAIRARELLRKIQLFITPDTDPGVTDIVERYEKATANEKLDLFAQLQQKRAWRQILKLYAGETDGQVQNQLQAQGMIELIPVTAARECLRRGDVAGARGFLEMAPANASGLLSLAEFHRSQGTLDQELKRAMTVQGRQGAAWRLALYRAAGNLEAARDAADEADEPAISAALSVLLGDPLPWLRRDARGNELRGSRMTYTDLAIKRWQGSVLRPSDLEPLEKALNSRNRVDRNGAIGVLFLLGDPAPAEKALIKHVPLQAFSYFEAQERIPEALSALGLDPAKPDYENWVRERMEKLTDVSDDEDQEIVTEHDMELITLAGFLERRGLHDTCAAAFTAPLESLATKDEEVFIDFISRMFLDGRRIGAPGFASKFFASWAGQDDDRWDQIVSEVFSDSEEMTSVWDWLAELDPKATRSERLDTMLALRGMVPDTRKLAEKWRELAWAAVGQAPEDKRQPLVEKLTFLINLSTDAASSLRLWELLSEEGRSRFFWQGTHAMNLSAAGRWDEVAAFYMNYIDRVEKMNLDPQPEWHASVAASLRQAGRPEEAAKHDSQVEKLSLGRDAIAIGVSYAFGHDYERAAVWWARAARQCDPDSEEFAGALQLMETALMEGGRWKEAAAISEARARTFASSDVTTSHELMLMARGMRLNSDLARALANLSDDRAGSMELLANCHRLYPNDASIADNFFPAVRKAGLMKEHDAWFKESWARMMQVVDEFPDADNTGNSAGWLASRARRNLGEAEAMLEKSLAARPDQSAYLDTMAEIQFARGNRAKALEWSLKAINFAPTDEVFRRQYVHFTTAPLPR